MSNTKEGRLPPLSDEERAEVQADFNRWYEANAAEDHTYDRSNGELTWQWAYWHYHVCQNNS